MFSVQRAARAAIIAAVVAAVWAASFAFSVTQHADASGQAEQGVVYNCDGTSWAFRATRLSDGQVGFSYGINQPSSPNTQWYGYVPIGGSIASLSDVSITCLAGKVWVLAKFTTPVDGTGRIYERHGYPEDLANGYGGGFTDWWYHIR